MNTGYKPITEPY